ncbi:MAG: hypothetical protein KDD48_04950 [Bdellovibrionales bacterium]|nr:hypothetical protein [Bdellovibrionales bacterium]
MIIIPQKMMFVRFMAILLLCFSRSGWAYPDQVATTFSLTSVGQSMELLSNERFLYVLSSSGQKLMTVDAFLGRVVHELDLTGLPRAMALDSDGLKLYIATDQFDQLTKISLEKPSEPVVESQLSIGTLSKQYDQILITNVSDQKKIILMSQSADRIYIYDLNDATLVEINPEFEVQSIAIAPSNRWGLLSTDGRLKIYSTTSNSQVSNTLDFGGFTAATAFSHLEAKSIAGGSYAFLTRTSNPGEIWVANLSNSTFYSSGSLEASVNSTGSRVMSVLRPLSEASTAEYLFTLNSTDQSLSIFDVSNPGGSLPSSLQTIDNVGDISKHGFGLAPVSGFLYALLLGQPSIQVISDQPIIRFEQPPTEVSDEGEAVISTVSSQSGNMNVFLMDLEESEMVESSKGTLLSSTAMQAGVLKEIVVPMQRLIEGANLLGFFLTHGDYEGRSAIKIIKDTTPSVPSEFRLLFGNEKIFVRWNRSSEADLAHYNISFGLDSSAEGGVPGLVSPIQVPQSASSELQFILNPLTNDQRVFVKIQAVDQGGKESPFSEALSEIPEQTIGILGLSLEKGGCRGSKSSMLLIGLVFFWFLIVQRQAHQKFLVVCLCALSAWSFEDHRHAKYTIQGGAGWWIPKDPNLKRFLGSQGNEVYAVHIGFGLNDHFDLITKVEFLNETSALLGINSGRSSGETQTLLMAGLCSGVRYRFFSSFDISPYVSVGQAVRYFSVDDPSSDARGMKHSTVMGSGIRFLLDKVLLSQDPKDMLGIYHVFIDLSATYNYQWSKGLDFGGWLFSPTLGLEF